MLLEHGWIEHVKLVDINFAALALKELLILGDGLGGARRTLNHLDRYVGASLGHVLLSQRDRGLVFVTDGASDPGDADRLIGAAPHLFLGAGGQHQANHQDGSY